MRGGHSRAGEAMCPNTPVISFLCHVVTLNGLFQWGVVGRFLFSPFIMQAAIITVVLAVMSQVMGVLIGLLLYFMRQSRISVFRWLANTYVWVFRGTPLLLQILLTDVFFTYSGLYHVFQPFDFFPKIGFPLVQLSLFVEAFVALSFNEGAYMSEVVRAGIEAIDVGQLEAAKSLGMTYGLAMRRIILPQAARVMIPPLGNEFNNMLKSTSLAETIALAELIRTSTLLGSSGFVTLEIYVDAGIWYLAMTTVWTAIQVMIERRLNVSVLDSGPTDRGSFWSRVFGFGRRGVAGVPGEAVAGLATDRR
jgi:polar amino acid transport system permease protein